MYSTTSCSFPSLLTNIAWTSPCNARCERIKPKLRTVQRGCEKRLLQNSSVCCWCLKIGKFPDRGVCYSAAPTNTGNPHSEKPFRVAKKFVVFDSPKAVLATFSVVYTKFHFLHNFDVSSIG